MVDASGAQKEKDGLKQVFYDTSEMGLLFREFNDFMEDDKASEFQVHAPVLMNNVLSSYVCSHVRNLRRVDIKQWGTTLVKIFLKCRNF